MINCIIGIPIGLADVYNDDLENDENDDDFEADENEGDSDDDLAEEEEGEDDGILNSLYKIKINRNTKIILKNVKIFCRRIASSRNQTKA